MRPVFKRSDIEEQFQRDGYCILPFLEKEAVEELRNRFLALRPSDEFQGYQDTPIGKQSFHITFFDSDADYKRAVLDLAKETFASFCETYLDDYTCVQANAFIKPAGKGFVHPHQNLTIVDESRFTSLSLWMPFQDTTFDNGTLCVIPGSHNGFEDYRNTHIYWPYIHFFREERGLQYFQAINVRAGEVLILHDRLVHYTPDNITSEPRWVFHSLWQPTEADTFFFDPTEDKVRVYQVDKEYWQLTLPGQGIGDLKPIEVRPNNTHRYSETELIEVLEALKKR